MMLAVHFCLLSFLVVGAAVAMTVPTKINYTWPNTKYDALEQLLFEGTRLDGLSLSASSVGCRNRDGLEGRGTGNVAAEWVRFAFHDAITHNIDDGSGGVDASLFYELARDENRGQGMKDTAAEFLKFANKYVSRADIVAMGAVFGMTSCGGQNILPFGGGRVDATSTGRSGVPLAEHSVEQFNEAFRHFGFNAAQTIAITVCGHALGGVRSNDFPEIVPPTSNPHEVVFRNFDSTAQFDLRVVTEYLNGNTSNPLAVNTNQTILSDKRLFDSDGGAVLRRFRDAGDGGFKVGCREAYRVMINTTPTGVNLTEINVLPAKVAEPRITIEDGELIFKVDLRLTQNVTIPIPPKRTVIMQWCDRRGPTSDCNGRFNTAHDTAHFEAPRSPVTEQLGLSLQQYAFRVPVDARRSVGKFWFVVDEQDGSPPTVYQNGGDGYHFQQDNIVFLPSLSSSLNKEKTLHKMVAGVRLPLAPSRVSLKTFQPSTSNEERPKQGLFQMLRDVSVTPVKGYALYSAEVPANLPGLTIDLEVEVGQGETYREEYLNADGLGSRDDLFPLTDVVESVAQCKPKARSDAGWR